MLPSGIQDLASHLHVADAVHVLDPLLQHEGMTEEVTSQTTLVMTVTPGTLAKKRIYLLGVFAGDSLLAKGREL